jgi:putative transferase (TIGR04331 family)
LIPVGTHLKNYFICFGSHPQPLQAIAERAAKIEVIAALKPEIRKHVLYRPYPTKHGGLGDRGYVGALFPQLPILGGNLEEALWRCKLAVVLDPGTAWAVALAAQIPVIGCWSQDAWPMCAESGAVWTALKNAKIVFDSPRDACAHIERIWDDVEGWWAGGEVQAVRDLWVNRNGQNSKD